MSDMYIVVIGGLYFLIAVHLSHWDVRRKEIRRLHSGILGRNLGEPQTSQSRWPMRSRVRTGNLACASSEQRYASPLLDVLNFLNCWNPCDGFTICNQESVKSGDARCVPAVSVHWIRTCLQTLTVTEWETYFIVRGQTAYEILKATCFKCQQVTLTVSLCI